MEGSETILCLHTERGPSLPCSLPEQSTCCGGNGQGWWLMLRLHPGKTSGSCVLCCTALLSSVTWFWLLHHDDRFPLFPKDFHFSLLLVFGVNNPPYLQPLRTSVSAAAHLVRPGLGGDLGQFRIRKGRDCALALKACWVHQDRPRLTPLPCGTHEHTL